MPFIKFLLISPNLVSYGAVGLRTMSETTIYDSTKVHVKFAREVPRSGDARLSEGSWREAA